MQPWRDCALDFVVVILSFVGNFFIFKALYPSLRLGISSPVREGQNKQSREGQTDRRPFLPFVKDTLLDCPDCIPNRL